MSYQGDIAEDQAFSFHFTTRKDTGLPTTLSGTPVLSVYKDDNLTQTTTGPTLTVDADGVTGYNRVDMVTTNAFYVASSDYSIVITTGTVNSISVIGEVVATFSIDNRGLLKTTPATLVDLVWDELHSGHNVGGSFGKDVRQIKEGTVSAEAAVNGGTPTTTSFITNLTEVTDDHYLDVTVVFIDGTLMGQARPVLGYNGTTKTLTFDEAFTEAPADGDAFIIKTDHVHPISQIAEGVWDEVFTELAQGQLPTTPTGRQAVMALFMALRNAIDVDSGFKEFYNNAGTVIWKKAVSDDGSNYIEAKSETGP